MRMNDAAEGISERLLPPSIKRMIRSIGLPATLTLLEALGGTRIQLSLGARRRVHRSLVELIGADASKALYAEFCVRGVKELMLPKVDKILRQARDAAIRAECETQQIATVALRYKLTMRQIQKIRRSSDYPIWRRPAPPQLELFGAEPADSQDLLR